MTIPPPTLYVKLRTSILHPTQHLLVSADGVYHSIYVLYERRRCLGHCQKVLQCYGDCAVFVAGEGRERMLVGVAEREHALSTGLSTGGVEGLAQMMDG
jgi:hypothetical protein